VVNLSGQSLLRRLVGVLLQFSFGLEEDGVVFCAMVGFTITVHVVRRLECVRVAATTVAIAWHAPL
jgi:hypothetical protein